MACSRASAERSPISPSVRSPRLLRVALRVEAAQVELAIAAWELVGVYNSSVEYQFDLFEEPMEEPWPGYDHRPRHDARAEVAAYLPAERWQEIESAARSAVANLLGRRQILHVKHLPNRDWRTAWHDHFDLVRVPAASDHSRAGGNPAPPTIIVRPPHISYDAQPGEVVVDLVPGLAFGTGQHQSTRLCLRLLAEQMQGGERVLDVGTGSGILAATAARLGAESVLATDVDPIAVDAAGQTIRQNQLGNRVEVREGSIPPGQQFDVITANLTADLLQYLAGDLAGALDPGGRLIASGLIAARRDEVVATFSEHGLAWQSERSEDEWRALVLVTQTTRRRGSN